MSRKRKNKNRETTVSYDNTERNEDFEMICRMTQEELRSHLISAYDLRVFDGVLVHEGTVPIVLTAHMDTVHATKCSEVKYLNGCISSPQGIGGDDRCGVYMITQILDSGLDCWAIFCEDEESGSIGARAFVKTEYAKSLIGEFQFIIELDRMNAKDAVFYELDNAEFEQFVCKEYWKKAYGSWSDICTLAPALGCAAVNLSCGYYNPHTLSEYVNLDIMYQNIDETISLINRAMKESGWYEWKEAPKKTSYNSYCWYDDDDDYYGYGYGDGMYSGYSALHDVASVTNDSVDSASLAVAIKDDITATKLELNVMLTLEASEMYGYNTSDILTATGNTKAECWFNLLSRESWLCIDDVDNWWWE